MLLSRWGRRRRWRRWLIANLRALDFDAPVALDVVTEAGATATCPDELDELSIPRMLATAKKRKVDKERIARACDNKADAMMNHGVRVNPLLTKRCTVTRSRSA